jgi:hypothetical protein
MDKAEHYLSLSIIAFILFISLAALSNYKGLSPLLYGSYICLALVFLFFMSSLRAMGQRDLFDVLGSVAYKVTRRLPPGDRAPKGSTSKTITTATTAPKTSGSKPLEQGTCLYQKRPVPPPPPPHRDAPLDGRPELICPSCGQKLPRRAAFCGRCGLKLREPDVIADEQHEET